MNVVECIQVLSSALTLNQYSSILQSLSTLTCLKETGSFHRILCWGATPINTCIGVCTHLLKNSISVAFVLNRKQTELRLSLTITKLTMSNHATAAVLKIFSLEMHVEYRMLVGVCVHLCPFQLYLLSTRVAQIHFTLVLLLEDFPLNKSWHKLSPFNLNTSSHKRLVYFSRYSWDKKKE